jgi:hypothetical protein
VVETVVPGENQRHTACPLLTLLHKLYRVNLAMSWIPTLGLTGL